MTAHIAIVGGGAWGTALATAARRAGSRATIWAREADVVDAIERTHENPAFLPGVALDPAIRATTQFGELAAADFFFVVTPAQHFRATLATWRAGSASPEGLVICTKGIERESGLLLDEVAKEIFPAAALAVLSGPTFAAEVAAGKPAAVTLAASDREFGRDIVSAIGSRNFRPYLSDDVAGAGIGGAVKNILAIACGIVIGRGLGENARAALLTRGLAEMARLGQAKGAKFETFVGLSGFGDLSLTCNSPTSRNMSLGLALGKGEIAPAEIGKRGALTEGVATAAAVAALAARLSVDMPICRAVDDVVNRGADIDVSMAQLLARPFRAEIDGAVEAERAPR